MATVWEETSMGKLEMTFSRKALFRRLPFTRALGIAISIAARKIFDRFSADSYAEGGLDRQILGHLLGCRSKFYVDVGCHCPNSKSNTYLLYQMGWSGLCIDANLSLVRRFQRVRPKDRVECVCVGEESGETTFLICNNPALSHVFGDGVPHSNANDEAYRVTVQVKSLQQLFDEHNVPRSFGLLSIDVEGSDLAVIRSFNIHKWRPYLIVVEIHDDSLEFEQIDKNDIVVFLRSTGYNLVGYNNMNALFLDVEGSSHHAPNPPFAESSDAIS